MESKKLVLIIDDEADFVETVQFFLTNSNFRVITAPRGDEGIEKARFFKPNLILLDVNMPGIDGYEVCRRIKENDQTKYIPVIMLTVKNETLDKVTALNIGAADYIGKHFPFEEILARIRAVLRDASPDVMPQAVQERNKKVIDLKKIIEEKNIRILYQPIVSMPSRKPMGYEALTRGPKGSFFENPELLFDSAAESNMFYDLDTLCRSLSVKKVGPLNDDQILFLNADPSVIDTDHFKKLEFLEGSAIRPSQICLEISERTCITNFAKLSSELNALKKSGIKVAIDDVGAGYSSLRSIAELEPEYMKADIALVRAIDSNQIKNSLVQALITLSEKLNCRLIAEGVETESEYNTLLSLGVKYAQGYLFGKPAEHL